MVYLAGYKNFKNLVLKENISMQSVFVTQKFRFDSTAFILLESTLGWLEELKLFSTSGAPTGRSFWR